MLGVDGLLLTFTEISQIPKNSDTLKIAVIIPKLEQYPFTTE